MRPQSEQGGKTSPKKRPERAPAPAEFPGFGPESGAEAARGVGVRGKNKIEFKIPGLGDSKEPSRREKPPLTKAQAREGEKRHFQQENRGKFSFSLRIRPIPPSAPRLPGHRGLAREL